MEEVCGYPATEIILFTHPTEQPERVACKWYVLGSYQPAIHDVFIWNTAYWLPIQVVRYRR